MNIDPIAANLFLLMSEGMLAPQKRASLQSLLNLVCITGYNKAITDLKTEFKAKGFNCAGTSDNCTCAICLAENLRQ